MSDTAGAFLLGAGAGLLASAVVAFVWARTRRRPGTVEDPGRRADLTSKIGHELKNPVMSVKGLASSGIRLYPSMSDDERLEFFRLIDDEASRLKLTIEQSTTAMRIEAGSVSYDLQPTDVGALVEEEARSRDVTVEAGEGERLEAIVAVRVGEGGILGQELAHPLGYPERSGLEDVQRGLLREQLGNALVVASVECLEQVCHTI